MALISQSTSSSSRTLNEWRSAISAIRSTNNQPVLPLIAQRIPATILLSLLALFLAVGLGKLIWVVGVRPATASVDESSRHNRVAHRICDSGILVRDDGPYPFRKYVAHFFRRSACARCRFLRICSIVSWISRTTSCCAAVTLSLLFIASYARLARASMMDVLVPTMVRTSSRQGSPRKEGGIQACT